MVGGRGRLYSLSLLHDLKAVLLEAVARSADLHTSHRRPLFSLFAEIMVANESAFTEAEIRNAFASMGAEGLAECASHFGRKLEAAGDKAAALWQGTIGPMFEQYWPKTRRASLDYASGWAGVA